MRKKKAQNNVRLTCGFLFLHTFPPVSTTKFAPFPEPYQIQLVSQETDRGGSSLWPQGTVAELPSGTSPGPPQNPKSGIQNPKSQIPQSKIQTFSAKIQTFSAGFRGFWILDRYVAFLYVRPPPPQILDFPGGFGFRILDFGVAILPMQILDFGFWNFLDFGFWILDFGCWFGGVFADIFWMLHNIITVHADPGRRIIYIYIHTHLPPQDLPLSSFYGIYSRNYIFCKKQNND